jgi:SAM-dependent methyltransferase
MKEDREKPKSVGTSTGKDWEKEYENGGIPSSVRERPSNVVVFFEKFLSKRGMKCSTGIDIGCGGGRNSLFLSEMGYEILAFDFVKSQVEKLNVFINQNRVCNLTVKIADVSKKWPWEPACADFAIDTFCFKHQIEMESIYSYISNLKRCLKSGGLFMLYLAMNDDGYYRTQKIDYQSGTGTIILDSGNFIFSRIYNRAEVQALFSDFEVLYFENKLNRNVMHGKEFDRSSGVWVFRLVE